jgi:hypothetical protein
MKVKPSPQIIRKLLLNIKQNMEAVSVCENCSSNLHSLNVIDISIDICGEL